MIKTYTLKSPAKINIGLRILSKRKDGYHNIETIFYPVKIFDEIRISVSKLQVSTLQVENKINVKAGPDIDDKNNICYKAVKNFMDEFKIKDGYEINIRIKKNIPVGAGLGGGSSDAAGVLKKLLQHCHPELVSGSNIKIQKHARIEILSNIALKLGSDVPFFLSPKPAYATSRGEKLTALPDFKIRHKILIVNPGIHVSTKWAYEQLHVADFRLQVLKKIKTFKISDKEIFVNDFEEPVFKKYPQIGKIKDKMYERGAVFSLMSGSGSTVYGFFTPKKVKAAEKYFRSLGYKVFIS